MAAFRAAAVARNTSAAAIDRSRPCCSHLRAAVRELASPLVVIGQCAAALPPSQWLLLAASAVGLALILPAVSISGWQARMLVLVRSSVPLSTAGSVQLCLSSSVQLRYRHHLVAAS